MTTQKEKQLLLQDLSARLSYGVKIVIQDTFKYSIVSPEYYILDVSNFSDIFCFNYKKFDKRMKKAMRERPNDIVIKPYLVPLSSMTEEQKKEYESIIYYNIELHCERCYNVIDIDSFEELQEFYHKYHLDYRGLIPMGLAVDATNLNIY